MLASVLEKSEDIIADNDAGLAAQDIGDTHICGCLVLLRRESVLRSVSATAGSG